MYEVRQEKGCKGEVMFFGNIIANLISLFVGIMFIMAGKRDKNSNYYPKWLYLYDYFAGIVVILIGFSIWFMN